MTQSYICDGMDTAPAVESAVIESLELLQVALTKTIATVPYNSASQFLEFFENQFLASNWGMSCVRQSVWADEFYQSLGGNKGTYIREGRHVASIYRETGALLVLDPYLLHATPVVLRLCDAKDGRIESSVAAYPARQDRDGAIQWGKLRTTWDLKRQNLCLDYIRFSPRRQQNYLYRSFTLNLTEEAHFPSPKEAAKVRLVHPEQNNLSVRALNFKTQSLAEVILPLSGLTCETPGTIDGFISRDNQGQVSVFGAPSFDDDLAQVASSVGVSTGEIIETLLYTSRVYTRVAPKGRTLAPYSLVSE